MKHFSLSAVLFAVAILCGGCSDTKKHDSETAAKAPAEADALVATTTYRLNTLQGDVLTVTKEGPFFTMQNIPEHVVVYDIFATWCPPCRAEAPHLSKLQKAFAGKIKIVGVSIEENKDDDFYRRFAKDIGIDYTLVNAFDNIPLARAIAGSLGLGRDFPIPLMVIYKDGKYVKHYTGLVPEEMLESDLKQLVK